PRCNSERIDEQGSSAGARTAPCTGGSDGHGGTRGSVRIPRGRVASANRTKGRGSTCHPGVARPGPGAHVGADRLPRRVRVLAGGSLVVRGATQRTLSLPARARLV